MSSLLSNRLAAETSPYLLQHADNPVHWQPWDAQSLALARDEKRPDLDQIYQTAHQMLTQRSGGWPLTPGRKAAIRFMPVSWKKPPPG